MIQNLIVSCLASAAILTGPAAANGIYGAKSAVLQINAKNYDSLIAQSNHTSVTKTIFDKTT